VSWAEEVATLVKLLTNKYFTNSDVLRDVKPNMRFLIAVPANNENRYIEDDIVVNSTRVYMEVPQSFQFDILGNDYLDYPMLINGGAGGPWDENEYGTNEEFFYTTAYSDPYYTIDFNKDVWCKFRVDLMNPYYFKEIKNYNETI